MNPFERILKRYQTLPEVDLAQGRSIAYSRSTTMYHRSCLLMTKSKRLSNERASVVCIEKRSTMT